MKKNDAFNKAKKVGLKPADKIKTPHTPLEKATLNEEMMNVKNLSKEEILDFALSKSLKENTQDEFNYFIMAIEKGIYEEEANQSEENQRFICEAAILLCNSYIKHGFTWRVKKYADLAFNALKNTTITSSDISKYFELASIYALDDRYAQEIQVLDYLKQFILYNEKNDEDIALDIYQKEFKAQKILFGDVTEELLQEAKDIFGDDASNKLYQDLMSEEYLKVDLVENTNQYLEIKEELEERIYEKLGMNPDAAEYYDVKREILLSFYGINWKSPIELNKGIKF